MTEPRFGTDGIRGVANLDLTPELALGLGRAAGTALIELGGHRAVAIGRDTRQSGRMLETALASGFASVGVHVDLLGVAPTPAVSYVVRTGDSGLGAVISASHNPAPDNGIKFFDSSGAKPTDEFEASIEHLMSKASGLRPTGGDIGGIVDREDLLAGYEDYLVGLLPEGLEGMKVAIDAANGAAYSLAPTVLRRLGADIQSVGVKPNGVNVNAEGGATKPETICKVTADTGSAVGVALDGDADRAIFSDGKGRLINGDQTIGAWVALAAERGELRPRVVVGTIMTNGGMAEYLHGLGVDLIRTPVGDKYVARELNIVGGMIGGEQSGHIIFPHLSPTGDGLITMLEFLRVIKRSGRSATHWADAYKPWPQVLTNFAVASPKTWSENATVKAAVEEIERSKIPHMRVNVRASGTQPILRVMIEADTYEKRDTAAARIERVVLDQLGGTVAGRVDLTHALGD